MRQPAPKPGQDVVFPLAFEDLREFVEQERPDLRDYLEPALARLGKRVEEGTRQYGTPLMTFNGRDGLRDAWEEAADLVFYLTQLMHEQNPFGSPYIWEPLELAQETLLLLTALLGDDGIPERGPYADEAAQVGG